MKTLLLKTAADTENAAAEIAAKIKAPTLIYLEGQLGAGKTTFVKGFLRGLGCNESVKSPTYTLVETYSVKGNFILHADLYRIKDVNELDAMGFRDYFDHNTIALIEWASKAQGWLPKPDLLCTLKMSVDGNGRILELSDL